MNFITIQKTKINNQNINSVNARDLYKFLESKQDFATWIKNRLQDFQENVDYIRFHKKMEANNATKIEYILTLETAKHISMIERNDKGREIRQYFIDFEKRANNTKFNFLINHTQRQTQITNSKLINSKYYKEGGVEGVRKYNIENCKTHSGKTPKEIKTIGKELGLKSKYRTSAKEVLRHTRPNIACTMSLADMILSNNPNKELKDIKPITLKATEVFDEMLKADIIPAELNY